MNKKIFIKFVCVLIAFLLLPSSFALINSQIFFNIQEETNYIMIKTGNEEKYNVEMNAYKQDVSDLWTKILSYFNFKKREYENLIAVEICTENISEKEIIFKNETIYIYEEKDLNLETNEKIKKSTKVYDKLSVKNENDIQIKQLNRSFISAKNSFCYYDVLNPLYDVYRKYGENSIILIRSYNYTTDAVINNTLVFNNFSVLEINRSSSPYNNLVAYWSFDGDTNTTAFDLSGNNFHGTYVNGAYSGAGLYGNAGIFNGKDFISATPNFGGEAFSFSFWFNPNRERNFTRISAGGDHSCAVLSDGTAICWGRNLYGQIGDNFSTHKTTPVFVLGNYNFLRVSNGFYHTCGILTDGSAMCWGLNNNGQLGDGTTTRRITPTFVSGNYNFLRVSNGYYHTCGILTNGSALCWGRNTNGQLGDGTTTQRNAPVFVSGNYVFSTISAGNSHTCGILTDGSAMCWGSNNNGQLGDGTTTQRNAPVFVSGNYVFSTISAGNSHTCGILTNGSAMCWGLNLNGQLGDGTTTQRNTPVFVNGNYIFSNISTGGSHTCGILTNGSAMCWGLNTNGQLGDSTTTQRNTPVFVSGNYVFSNISAGSTYSCGVLVNGSTLCWGSNIYGQIGDGTNNQRNIPAFVSGNYVFRSISTGDSHTCGILTNSSTLCWGHGEYGQLGDGTDIHKLTPSIVLGNHNFFTITGGLYHTCGILTNGSAMCWGFNSYGQLGDGTTIHKLIPVFVSGNYIFANISTGNYYTCGILTNGSAMCWGLNLNGQLGDGTSTQRNTPVFVNGNYVFSTISTGGSHTCGILTNGSAMCWGLNTNGQLGDSTTTQRNMPVFVSGNYIFSNISAGGSHTCGILTNGSALCWGLNTNGQLGDGTTTQRNAPIFVSGNYVFRSISAGGSHTCGILINSSTLCWGRGDFGQIGDGTTTQRNSPVFVSGNYNFSTIVTGSLHTCGILTNGSALCWGSQGFGQLGNVGPLASTEKAKVVLGHVIGNNNTGVFSTKEDVFTIINNVRMNSSISNDWNYVVLTHNLTRNILFINGQNISELNYFIDVPTINDILIGRGIRSDIDEIMIFNKSLTQEEINEIYNNQSNRFKNSGTLAIINQSYLNLSGGGYSKINVKINKTNLLNTNIGLKIGFFNGSWHSTEEQLFNSSDNLNFTISSTAENITLNFTFFANNSNGNASFYSPYLMNTIINRFWLNPSINIILDKSPPINYLETLNISCSSNSNSINLFLNEMNNTLNNNKKVIYGAGDYLINCLSLETEYYAQNNKTLEFSINKISPTNNMQIIGTSPIIYGVASDFQGIETNEGDDDVIYNLSPENKIYGAGTQEFVYSATEGQNYTSGYIKRNLTINKNPSPCLILFNKQSPITYEEDFKVFGNCSDAFILKRNGSIIENNSIQELGAGDYIFEIERIDIHNYSNVYNWTIFKINKKTPPLNIISSAGWILKNVNYSEIRGINCPVQINCTLYEIDVEVTNPFTKLFSVGTYLFTYNTSGGENYTAFSISKSLNSQATSVILNQTCYINTQWQDKSQIKRSKWDKIPLICK